MQLKPFVVNGWPNSIPSHGSREALEAQYGQVWNTEELSRDFQVIGFLAPLVAVYRKSDGQKGSLEFVHSPRLYFNFVSHGSGK